MTRDNEIVREAPDAAAVEPAAAPGQLHAALNRIAELEKRERGWARLARGQAALLVCYRTGGHPQQGVFNDIEAARKVLGEMPWKAVL